MANSLDLPKVRKERVRKERLREYDQQMIAQSLILLSNQKSDGGDSFQVSDSQITVKELSEMECYDELERLSKLEKIRKITGYITLILILLIPLVNPILTFLNNQTESVSFDSGVKAEVNHSMSSADHSAFNECLIIFLTISTSTMVATYLIEYAIKVGMNKTYRFKNKA